MMRVLFVAIAAVMLLSSTDAHLDQVCSATSAAHPGRIDFYFGTYHGISEAKGGPGGKAPGTIYLSNSGGSKLTSSFKEMFAPSTTYYTSTVEATKAALIKAVNNKNIIDDKSMVSCYTTEGTSHLPTPVGSPAGKWMIPAPAKTDYTKWGCKSTKDAFQQVKFWSRVSVDKATSGDWKLEITGTNAIFDPDGSKVCGLSKNSPRWIGGMQVANGEKSCTGTPTVSGGVDPASVAGCKNLLGGAVCANWKCKDSKATPSGSIKCSKGKYVSDAKCKGASACFAGAEKTIDTIQAGVNAAQKTIADLKDGSKCAAEGQAAVTTAKKAYDDAVAAAKKAQDAVDKAEVAPVHFGKVPLSTLVPGKCGQFFSGNAYTTAKNNMNAATTAKTKADAVVSTTKKNHADAVAAALKAKNKCLCETLKAAQQAYDTATANDAVNKKSWDMAHHLQCVENGEVTLNPTTSVSQGKCSKPACPTVTKPKLSADVKALKKGECLAAGMAASNIPALPSHVLAEVEQL